VKPSGAHPGPFLSSTTKVAAEPTPQGATELREVTVPDGDLLRGRRFRLGCIGGEFREEEEDDDDESTDNACKRSINVTS